MRHSEIQDLIKLVAKTKVSEVQFESDKVKLVIKNESVVEYNNGVQTVSVPQTVVSSAPAHAAAPAPVAAAPIKEEAKSAPKEDDSKYITVKSPMIGTAYKRPSPDKDEFVQVGDEIKPGDVICIIEAMKLFNEIESEVSGKIVKILIDDEMPVEYDQPLFLVDPS